MEKKIRSFKEWAENIKLGYAVILIVCSVLFGAGITIPSVGGVVKKIVVDQVTEIIMAQVPEIVEEKIKPVTGFLYADLGRMIEKNVKKVADKPDDIKLDDIRFVIERWPYFKDYNPDKKELYNNMVKKLNDWYITEIGG